ncbi:hypothetical protein AB6A40_000614 [Gnathostoma spinigerum]|uniref:Mesencephalic astrocyte-derived neurotrophic factor homolog n=1 Tax=Gnathostoma spinigerum TaxID=75299 RepID=A0ABD6EC80_9BILA
MFALFILFSLISWTSVCASSKSCEVCVKVLNDAMQLVPDADKSNPEKIGETIRKHCSTLKGKEHSLCFYIGALPDSLSSMMKDVQTPLSYPMPAEKVCEKLKKQDAQICELKYDVKIDWKTVDLKKMRVKELKKILEEWGESCKGCSEKSEYVARINELKAKYVSKSEL